MKDRFEDSGKISKLFEMFKNQLIDLCEKNANISEYQNFKKQVENASSFDEIVFREK